MTSPHEILWGVVFAAVAALVAVLADVRPWQRDRGGGRGGWGVAAAVSAALLLAFIGRDGAPPFPPIEVEGWIFYFAILAAVIAIAQRPIVRAKWWLGAIDALVPAAAIGWLMLRPQLRQNQLEPAIFWTWVAALALAATAWWAAMETLARRVRGFSLPLVLAISVGCAALVLVNAHSQRLGQYAGAVSVALIIATAVALWARESSLFGGAVLAVMIVLLGVLVSGRFYADLTTRDMVLLAAAPLAAWAGELPGLPMQRSWPRVLVRTIAVIAILAIPLVPAVKGLHETIQEQTQYEGP